MAMADTETRDANADDDDDKAVLRDFALHDAPGHLLRRCQQLAVEAFVREVGTDGLRPRQFALLYVIAMNAGLSQAELVRLSGIDRSTVAEMLGRLVDRGLLSRTRAGDDGRANAVTLTDAGRRALMAALPGVARAQARILAPLPADRRAGFVDDLRILAGLASE